MCQTRGAAKCPLSYVFREHEAVTNEMHMAVYDNHDDRLISTTTLTGPWFELDNHRVYEEFKVLTLKGPGWSFIKSHDRTKNGRAAVLALRRQCEGTSAVQSRKASAYAKIVAARYTGHRKTFTFDNYVEAHQAAYNTLADLGEAVPETKKVTDFLAGITDSRHSGAKDIVLGDAQRLQDFEACQQYFKTLVYSKTTQEHHERQISALKHINKNGKRIHNEGNEG
jgi:predicted acylesterase/phospholipase RssA